MNARKASELISVAAALTLAVGAPDRGIAQSGQEAALSDAAGYCRAADVSQLLGAGADPDALNSGGYTPLMRAAGEGCVEVVKLLLEGGADPTIRHPTFGDAADQAKMHQKAAAEAMIRAFGRETAGAPALAAADRGPEPNDRPPVEEADGAGLASAGGARDWPPIGAYQVGQRVLYSGSAGKTWTPAVVKAVDPKYGYSFEGGPSGSYSHYFVVAPQREPFWTQYFIGDWRVSVPMAMGAVTDGRFVYRTVSGGMRLPPLRIGADGTYSWRVQQGQGEQLIRGRWEPNPDGPGVILRNAEQGADWLVYNNTDALSTLGETVIISSDCCTHYDGARLD